jgi:C4-dicarboxylate transporter, DctQ subunit
MAALHALLAAYDRLVTALAALAAALIGVACVLIVVDVTIRTLGIPPPDYTIAVVEYELLYITMFAAPYLVRQRGHVYIDALVARLPPALERAVAKLAYAVAIAVSLIYAWYSAQLLLEAIGSGFYDERGVDMPLWSLYLPIPIGFGLVAIEFGRFLFGSQLMHRGPSQAEGSV